MGQIFLSATGRDRGKERSPEAEPLSSSIVAPGLELLLAADRPAKISRVWMSMANGMWVRQGGNAEPPFRGSKPARDCLRNPKSAAGRVGEDRTPGQAALARMADSGTPRGERTAVNDRTRAADAILAQSDMVGEPSPGYHDDSLAGLMTLPRIQRPLLPKKRPMWQHG